MVVICLFGLFLVEFERGASRRLRKKKNRGVVGYGLKERDRIGGGGCWRKKEVWVFGLGGSRGGWRRS